MDTCGSGGSGSRVRLRQWLEGRLNTGLIAGLEWLDRDRGIFKIPWKHHSKHTWHEVDAAIFKDWATVTGRFREGMDAPDWPMWKTRLRCALNKAPDIEEARQHHNLHCDEPFKVYRFVSRTESVWRANATRHASLIFDTPVSAVPHPHPQYHQQRVSNRPHIISVTSSSGSVCGNKPLTLLHKLPIQQHPQMRLKCFSLPLHKPHVAAPEPTAAVSSRHSHHHHLQQQHHAAPATRLLDSVVFPLHQQQQLVSGMKFSEVIEPELHQICLRIQHLEHRVTDLIVNNPNGCCIYFGRYDESLARAGPEPVQPQIEPFVTDADRYCVQMLLDNMQRGVVITADPDGSIYAEKLCRCAAFVYRPITLSSSAASSIEASGFELVDKLARRQRLLIFDYGAFVRELRTYQQQQHHHQLQLVGPPSVELVLAFGQQMKEGAGPDSLYVWCRLASCKAWFLLQQTLGCCSSSSPAYGATSASYGVHVGAGGGGGSRMLSSDSIESELISISESLEHNHGTASGQQQQQHDDELIVEDMVVIGNGADEEDKMGAAMIVAHEVSIGNDEQNGEQHHQKEADDDIADSRFRFHAS